MKCINWVQVIATTGMLYTSQLLLRFDSDSTDKWTNWFNGTKPSLAEICGEAVRNSGIH